MKESVVMLGGNGGGCAIGHGDCQRDSSGDHSDGHGVGCADGHVLCLNDCWRGWLGVVPPASVPFRTLLPALPPRHVLCDDYI
jgi:hypothetical protein